VKIGFGARIFLVVIVTLVACGYFGMAGVNADTEYQAGRVQIDKTMALIKKSTVDTSAKDLAALQMELSRLQGEIKSALGRYPSVLEETSMLGRVLEIALTDNVTVLQVTNREGFHKTDNYLYPSSVITVLVCGNAPSLLDFISHIEGGRSGPEKLVLPDLSISTANIGKGKDLPQAQLSFSVYATPSPVPPKKTPGPVAAKPKAA
jgi:hypothetical protein